MLNSMSQDEELRETIIKAPFAYPGGKSDSVQHILPHLPQTHYYCEPFGGAGSILLNRQPSKLEVFNDRYSGITDFYKCLKDSVLCKRLVGWLDLTVHSREMFIDNRDTWANTLDPVERAGKWYYMVQSSFQRYGRHFGRSRSHKNAFAMSIPKALERFWPVHYRLRGVNIENQDWRQLFRDYDNPAMVWYLDPPYVETTAHMYPHELTKQDHVEMCEMIQNLQGFVALSGYENTVYDKYPWTKKVSWLQKLTADAGIATGTNGREGTIKKTNPLREEFLWIRTFREPI